MQNKSYTNIDEYIKTFPEDIAEKLQKVRSVIAKNAPGAVETINYQMPTFKLNGRNLVHFAGYKNHVGFYPVPSGIEAFKEELAPYIAGKGSAQFKHDAPIPFDLIEKIVKFRVEEEKNK